MAIGRRIKSRRIELGLSVDEIASEIYEVLEVEAWDALLEFEPDIEEGFGVGLLGLRFPQVDLLPRHSKEFGKFFLSINFKFVSQGFETVFYSHTHIIPDKK